MANSETNAKISLLVNGEPAQMEAPATLTQLVQTKAPRPPFAIEVNKQLVRRGQFDQTVLNDGDRVEIVTLVGGG